MRLDLYLVKIGITESRNKAQEMIKQGLVLINNKIVYNPSFNVNDKDIVDVVSSLEFVSRAGYKLKHAIDNFNIDVRNKICLDIGASTGGFSDCLLQNNAKKVYALDSGTDQLHEKIANNQKVVKLENTNLKTIPDLNFEKIDIIVCDVSFISLKHVFQAIKSLLHKDIILLFLIKPQFELDSKTIIKSNYSIKNPNDRQKAINNVKDYACEYGLNLIKILESPIKGAKLKNVEYLAWFGY